MKFILKRLLKLFVASILLSTSLCLPYYFAWIPQDNKNILSIYMLIGFALFIVYNFISLSHRYNKMKDKQKYLTLSYTIYGIFVAISLLVFFIYEDAYSWCFNIFKVLRFTSLGLHPLLASAISHIIMVWVIYIVPKFAKNAKKQIRGRRVWESPDEKV